MKTPMTKTKIRRALIFAIVAMAFILLLLAVPVGLIFGWKWGAMVWGLLMFTNVVSGIKKASADIDKL